MTALDVPRETIMQDYLLTNAVFMAADSMDTATIITKANAGDLASQFNVAMAVEADNMKMVFRVFDDLYGNGIGYLREWSSMIPSTHKHMRKWLRIVMP
ncbi:hypothetical protein WP50_18960 [Lactiplantibacillus plantarum]|nr:hypothetical protein WP50_18960 [Lactiplantibacillus plantarum]